MKTSGKDSSGRTWKQGDLVTCERLICRVAPGSKGEARCPNCKLIFEFDITSQARFQRYVNVKKS